MAELCFLVLGWAMTLPMIAVCLLVYLLVPLEVQEQYMAFVTTYSPLDIRFYFSLLTYQLAHGSLSHVLFNCLIQLGSGLYLEHRLGKRSTACITLLGGVMGAIGFKLLLQSSFAGMLLGEARLIGSSAAGFALAACTLSDLARRGTWLAPVLLWTLLLGEAMAIASGLPGPIGNGGHLMGALAGLAVLPLLPVRVKPLKLKPRK